MNRDDLKQQIPDDLSLLYGIVQTHFGEGLAPVTNNGVKALIERIAELEAREAELKAELSLWRSEHDPCPFQLRMEALEQSHKALLPAIKAVQDAAAENLTGRKG